MLDKRTSLKRKKYQRDMNKIVRNLNENIKKDWLWAGRFTMRQAGFWCKPYDDHSGMDCYFLLSFKDNKTGRKEAKSFNQYSAREIWWWANECITNIWDVWKEDPNPNEQARAAGRIPD